MGYRGFASGSDYANLKGYWFYIDLEGGKSLSINSTVESSDNSKS